MNEYDWNALWNEPAKILAIQHENDESLRVLDAIKKRIQTEEKIRDDLKGIIFEGERKQRLIAELMQVDAILAQKIAALPVMQGTKDAIGKDAIEKLIRERIAELENHNKYGQKILQDALSEQKSTNKLAAALIERYLAIIQELETIRKKQLENEQSNAQYAEELRTALKNNTFEQNKKQFETHAIDYLERIQESKALDERAYVLIQEKVGLIEKSKFIQKQFETQTEKISGIRALFKKVFGSKEEKQEERKAA